MLTVAWKHGSLGDRDVSKEEFRARALQIVEAADVAYLLEGTAPKRQVPVGLVLGKIVKHRIEPTVYWFAWSTPRQMVECFVHFINEIRRTQLVIIPAPRADWRFLEHICRHGIMKRIGKSEDFMDWGEDGMLFQSLRPPMI